MKKPQSISSAALLFAVGCATAQPCPEAPPATPAPMASASAEVPPAAPAPADPLPSWNPTPARQAIETFVARVADSSGPGYVPPAERIAVFDNDGTLWVEHPVYTQLAFTLDRVRELAGQHPEWSKQMPFSAVLANDQAALGKLGTEDLMKLVLATHSGTSETEFESSVKGWLASATHPRFKRKYTELVYQPMLELMAYLRGHSFKTYIVSGGGIEFMRVFAEEVYGVPPEQVIGTTLETAYEATPSPVIVRKPKLNFIDDGPGKPMAIDRYIGRRPVMAFGNSDGDYQMLQWTTSGSGSRFGALVHHTDPDREFSYDRDTHMGQLSRGLDDAQSAGWVIIDMKQDWKTLFAE